MSLSELKFSTEKRPTPAFRSSPVEKARAAVLHNIEVQRLIVASEKSGSTHNLTKTIKSVDAEGNVTNSTVNRKPRRWFWKNPQGIYIVELLFSNQPVVIANGKTAVEAGDLDGVEQVLNILADATAKGELDKAFADIKAKRKPRSKKSA